MHEIEFLEYPRKKKLTLSIIATRLAEESLTRMANTVSILREQLHHSQNLALDTHEQQNVFMGHHSNEINEEDQGDYIISGENEWASQSDGEDCELDGNSDIDDEADY